MTRSAACVTGALNQSMRKTCAFAHFMLKHLLVSKTACLSGGAALSRLPIDTLHVALVTLDGTLEIAWNR